MVSSKLCCCCLSPNNLRDIGRPHLYYGQVEEYQNMIQNCFNITLFKGCGGEIERWICSSCVGRLRACCTFRKCVVSAKAYFDRNFTQTFTAETNVTNITSDFSRHTSQSCEEKDQEITHQNNCNIYEEFTHKEAVGKELNLNTNNLAICSDAANTTTKSYLQINNITSNNESENISCITGNSSAQCNIYQLNGNDSNHGIGENKQNECYTGKSSGDNCLFNPGSTDEYVGAENNYLKQSYLNSNEVLHRSSESNVPSVDVESKNECNFMNCLKDNVLSEVESPSSEDNSFFEYLDNPIPVTGDSECRIGDQRTLPYALNTTDRVCRLCNKEFAFFKNLLEHMHEHYPNHICDVCGKICATRRSLSAHSKTHTTVRYGCLHCDKFFKTRASLNTHIKVRHKGEKKYFTCSYCKQNFNTYNDRLKHLADKHGREDKMYKCVHCSCKYRLGSHLSTHVRRVHLQEKNHRCVKCGEAFFRKNSLEKHIAKHNDRTSYLCDICNKIYCRKEALEQHIRSHNVDNESYLIAPVQQITLTFDLQQDFQMRM